ncbi:hypothetical protein EVAR_54115_1 [Eumeta japonica]|uniref:Uncharacterized protein n=1 Tax=Eumeta variegata TaxID=151549 RepID=A0A4C1Z238_EUMVA|nr:hypothetical protein EVAR_54115_1 [Eumeta japonica]
MRPSSLDPLGSIPNEKTPGHETTNKSSVSHLRPKRKIVDGSRTNCPDGIAFDIGQILGSENSIRIRLHAALSPHSLQPLKVVNPMRSPRLPESSLRSRSFSPCCKLHVTPYAEVPA